MTKRKTAPGQRGKARRTATPKTAPKPHPDALAGTVKANPNELRVLAKKGGRRHKAVLVTKPGQRPEAFLAELATTPTIRAARTTQEYSRAQLGELDLTECVTALQAQIEAVNGGDMKYAEATLTAHAITLDAVFHALARRALLNFGEYLDAGERYLRLALKAQSQCRATLETLALIKNPPNVAFVRQANVTTGPQQVNNNTPAPDQKISRGQELGYYETCSIPARAREMDSKQSRLLEAQHGERLDTGANGAPSTANPQLETVGAIHRPKDRRR